MNATRTVLIRCRVLVVLVVACWLLAGGNRTAADPPGVKRTPEPKGVGAVLKRDGYRAVPLERRKNSNFLWLTVGMGGQDLRFVIDSAASFTAIDTATAKRLKLPVVGTTGKLGGLGGSDIGSSAALWPTPKVGGHDVPLPYTLVVDLGHVNKGQDAARADRIDGIIGADVLDLCSAVIDYTGPTLYLLDPAVGLKELQGEWRGVGVEHNGEQYPADHAKQYRFVFDGTSLRFEFGGERYEYRARFDRHASPKQMTWYSAEGATVQAVYEITGGKLRVAVPIYDGDNRSERPASFTPPKSNGFAVITAEKAAR